MTARLRGPAAALALLMAVPGVALGAFPGSNPDESVRVNTPNDPDFDCTEPDQEPPGPPTCSSVFDEETERFGFAPAGTQGTAQYAPTAAPPRQVAQNTTAGRLPLGQVSGVSADRAWKHNVGSPDVQVAILDTGIRWDNGSLRTKVWLNRDELPQSNGTCAGSGHDCNNDGAFDVDDYAGDSRVQVTDGHAEADAILDASDLIAEFSDSHDGVGAATDANGYVDDVAGWDFFDDDNDPFDASSYSSSNNHGTGRAREAAQRTNDGAGGTGVCPRCQVVPLRVWDTFVIDTNNFAMASLYATDNDIEVVEGAVGGLFNSRFAREVFDHAYRNGTFFAIVSSDLNTANHNLPTLYDEAFHVQGTVADVHGIGTTPETTPPKPFPPPPVNLIQFLAGRGINTDAPVRTWFRNSGTTQYGGHAHIVMPAVTGSAATGQASGAAGLVFSMGLEKGLDLEPNEVKQLLTTTAEDVLPENTAPGSGVPDPAQAGWDQHFGYGRPDLGLALQRVSDGKIPPQALITSPEWFQPFEVGRQGQADIHSRLKNRGGGYTWRLQWAPGIEPCDADFRTIASGSESGPREGSLGTVDLNAVRAALDGRVASTPCGRPPEPVDGGSTPDPTAPAKGPGDRDPNEPAFTVRVVVRDATNPDVTGEDRKVLFAHRDPTLHQGWSTYLGTGGEASQRMFDLDGDNRLDIVQADSSGDLRVLRDDGSPLPSFNGGQPVRARLYPNVHAGAPSYSAVAPPREVQRTPAIGDIDGDMEPEIVNSAGEHVYAWNADGSEVPGFPVRLDPSKSLPQDRTRKNHVKRGFSASPTLGDLKGDEGLEIVIPGLDQHLYAWDGTGASLAGFPVRMKKPGETNEQVPGAESINTAAVGDVNGDRRPDIVAATNEVDGSAAPSDPGAAFNGLVANVLANAIGGSGRVYAFAGDGSLLAGWPVQPNGALPDALPFAGPGVDHVLADLNGDGSLDPIGNLSTGDVQARAGSGSVLRTFDSAPGSGEHVDKSRVLNLFENPVAANLDGLPGPEVIKGGVTLQQLLNIGVAVGQNLPYNHVVQAWNAQTGASLPAFPQAVEDYQLLSSPMVADLSDAPGYEIVVGTGLYYVRNINSQGLEGAGWPKFTGGWNFAVPAAGDVDGDGKLEVSTLTREGNAFLWDTDRPACGTNDEWWTSRHDEWSTGAYGTDTRPPGTPRNLTVTRKGDGVVVQFVAPGDDWLCGSAASFRVLASEQPIEHPRDGRVLGEFRTPEVAGGCETQPVGGLGGDRYLAVMSRDDAGNWGHLASIEVPPGDGTAGPGCPRSTRDEQLPNVRISAPRYASDTSRSSKFRVSWSGADQGEGIDHYSVSVTERRARGSSRRTRTRTLAASTTRTSLSFRGRAGRSYAFAVTATDRAGNRSLPATAATVVPIDERSKRIGFSRSWKRVKRNRAYGKSVAQALRRGASARLRFTGTRLAVIGPVARRAARLRVTIDGRSRTVRVRGRARNRRVLFRSRRLRRGKHTVTVRALGGPVSIDALGVSP